MMPDRRSRIPALIHLAGFVGVLVVGWVVLVRIGADPRLTGPRLGAPSTWAGWAAAHEPLDAAFAVARLALLGGDLLLAASVVASYVVRLLGAVRAARLVDRVTVPVVRHLVDAAVGWGLVTTTIAAPTAAVAAPAARAATAVHAPMPPDGVPLRDPLADNRSDAPVLRRLPSDAAPGDPEPSPPPPEGPGPAAPADSGPSPTAGPESAGPTAGEPSAEREWTVRSGDHFWSIAEEVVRRSGGSAPRRATADYWLRLVDENRHRLADSDNPDLLFPGQVLVLPAGEP